MVVVGGSGAGAELGMVAVEGVVGNAAGEDVGVAEEVAGVAAVAAGGGGAGSAGGGAVEADGECEEAGGGLETGDLGEEVDADGPVCLGRSMLGARSSERDGVALVAAAATAGDCGGEGGLRIGEEGGGFASEPVRGRCSPVWVEG